jgi:anti-sigma factor RsiW
VDHQRAKELLSDYLDGELSSGESLAEIEQHLETCAECQAELGSLRETLAALGGLKPAEPSPDFLQQVHQKIRRRTKSAFDFSFGLDRKIPFEAVSMVLLGILLALYLLLVVLPKEHMDPDPPSRLRPDAGAPMQPDPSAPGSGAKKP